MRQQLQDSQSEKEQVSEGCSNNESLMIQIQQQVIIKQRYKNQITNSHMISTQQKAQTNSINIFTQHQLSHPDQNKISERVNKFIENNISQQCPPFIEEQVQCFSRRKLQNSFGCPRSQHPRTLLGFKLNNKGIKRKQKTNLSDWRKLMGQSQTKKQNPDHYTSLIDNQQTKIYQDYQDIYLDIPEKNQGVVSLPLQQIFHPKNSRKDRRVQSRFLESALMQNFYETQLNLTKRAQTAKIQQFYEKSERPSSISSSYRRFVHRRNDGSDINQPEIYERKAQTAYHGFREKKEDIENKSTTKAAAGMKNSRAMEKEVEIKESEFVRNQLNFQLFENSQIRKAKIRPFKIFNNLPTSHSHPRKQKPTNKSQFLKDVVVSKYDKARVKQKNIFGGKQGPSQHIPANSERVWVQRDKGRKASGQIRNNSGFLYSGTKQK